MTDTARHSWEREAEHHYRCTRCGCAKVNVLRPGRTDADPARWIATFERGGQRREGLTPPCPGRLPAAAAEVQPREGSGELTHVLNHVPALAEQDPAPDIHRGGCWFCRWIRRADMKCLHAAYGLPAPFMDARESGRPCGSRGTLWEPAHG
jgi:hypothetical protein